MDNTKTSEKLYTELFASASSKKKQTSLANIKKACDTLSSKYNKLTPASIGKYCQNKWETPKEQSIRNNIDYVQYISARENERPKVNLIKDQDVPVVKDQAAQAIIDILRDEIKDLKRSIKNLKSGMRQIAPKDIDEYISENLQDDSNINDDEKQSNHMLVQQNTECEITQVVEALNKNLLEKYCQITIEYKNGVIFNKVTGTTYWKSQND
ncbi:MAG TPA: hypothetical protein ENK98_05080 [Epsilonproteobacteria bacterium]|nr:hypothetical protein [Campylobacterota bacterium]